VIAKGAKMAEQKTTHTFKCPQCGGAQVYQAATSSLVCNHCGHQETIDAPTAGKTAGESEFTDEALAQAEHGWQVEHRQVQCQQCGGETLLPPGVLTQTCPYCGSTYVIGHRATDDLLRPHFMLPFRTTPERCRAITQEWLGSSWMTPRQLRKQANLDDKGISDVDQWPKGNNRRPAARSLGQSVPGGIRSPVAVRAGLSGTDLWSSR
jgi:predicted RNA-binding Zn-ribbon protein involved in translation (DUF1610 family)